MERILDQAVVTVTGSIGAGQITPGMEARLVSSEVGVVVMVLVTWTVLLVWSRQGWQAIGQLPPESAARIAPMLDDRGDLRVRVVNVTPPQLAPDGRLTVGISVWGRPAPEIIRPPDASAQASADSRGGAGAGGRDRDGA